MDMSNDKLESNFTLSLALNKLLIKMFSSDKLTLSWSEKLRIKWAMLFLTLLSILLVLPGKHQSLDLCAGDLDPPD
ncbi:hypothetical protein BpHYR1_045017 [Brachionus plicatilis]|uniref:Uncharacterized protein n=1 Tax=Brachionus plicatilis TaxID=10195 RepID=A0A3M7PVC4_BRAPC|nr:hypothetical protein BpHYR1_045017 [Brachionus plicatilis]